MEIEVGEYIKTVGGCIGRIINFEDGMYIAKMRDKFLFLYIDDIVKHSKNIINLIEVGDYVNGEKISNVDKIDNEYHIEWENGDYINTTENFDIIKDIATKEQFQQILYKVEE